MMWKNVGEQPLSCSTITLPLSLMHCKFTWRRTLARSLYVLLRKHKMTHIGEKAHKFNQCLPCIHAPSFKIQMRTHMEEKSYKCRCFNDAMFWKKALPHDVFGYVLEKVKHRTNDALNDVSRPALDAKKRGWLIKHLNIFGGSFL